MLILVKDGHKLLVLFIPSSLWISFADKSRNCRDGKTLGKIPNGMWSDVKFKLELKFREIKESQEYHMDAFRNARTLSPDELL